MAGATVVDSPALAYFLGGVGIDNRLAGGHQGEGLFWNRWLVGIRRRLRISLLPVDGAVCQGAGLLAETRSGLLSTGVRR